MAFFKAQIFYFKIFLQKYNEEIADSTIAYFSIDYSAIAIEISIFYSAIAF